MEPWNSSRIAAALIASFAAGASGAWLGNSWIPEAYRMATLKTLEALPHFLTATADGTDRLPEHREPPARHLTAAPVKGDGPTRGLLVV